MEVKFQDYLAGAMALILLTSIVILTAFERSIPEGLWGAFGISVGYVFRGGVIANGNRARRDNDNA